MADGIFHRCHRLPWLLLRVTSGCLHLRPTECARIQNIESYSATIHRTKLSCTRLNLIGHPCAQHPPAPCSFVRRASIPQYTASRDPSHLPGRMTPVASS
ncbi:hypothetical protein C8R44DRAFT_854561, partial [Mycena epipterygia]